MLAICIFFSVCIVMFIASRMGNKSRKGITESQLMDTVSRIRADIMACNTLVQLERLMPIIYSVCDKAAEVTNDWVKLERMMLTTYYNKQYALVYEEYPGIEQKFIQNLKNQ